MPVRINIIIIMLLLLQLSGCWDSQGLDKLAFPLAAAYDIHTSDSDDPRDPSPDHGRHSFDVTTLVPNLAPKSPKPVSIDTLSGTSAGDVRQKRGLIDADAYEIGINKVFIVGEKLAGRGLNQYMDSLLRSAAVPGTVFFAVAAGRGEDILKAPAENDTNMGLYLISLFNGLNSRAFMPVSTLRDFYHQGKGRNPVAPILELKGGQVIISGTAVFKKDKLVQKLDVDESRDLVLLRGIKSRSYLPFGYGRDEKDFRAAALVGNTRKVQYYQNRQGHNFIITVKISGTLEEHNHMVPITEKHLLEIENTLASQLKSRFETFIDKMQNDFKFDCIDILKYALAKNRRALEKDIDRPEFIENAHIQVQVKVHLENTGGAR